MTEPSAQAAERDDEQVDAARQPSGSSPADASPPRKGGRRLIAASAVLTAVVVGLAVVLGLYLPGYLHGHARDSARDAALSAARQRMVNFMNYDYRHYDRYLKRVADGSTGTFKKQFTKAEKVLKAKTVKAKATASGKVLDAGVEQLSSDGQQASVLLYIDETVSGPGAAPSTGKGATSGKGTTSGKAKSGKGGTAKSGKSSKAKSGKSGKAVAGNGGSGKGKSSGNTLHYRADVTMQHVHGHWLVAGLRFL